MNTRVIVLGVGHSNQLVSKFCQPAVYRAFIDRIKPDVIGIERSPLEYNRSDFYEFTYEQQYIIVPYAKKKQITLRPFDWLPTGEDQQLAWNTNDIEQPPVIRGKVTYKDFIYFNESSVHEEGFFYSETDELKLKLDNWLKVKGSGESDFPRRLFMYRTYMQAMRIKQIAMDCRGATLLVVVGHMHKSDIENILSSTPYIDLIQPSQFGYPEKVEIEENIEVRDLFAIATFNLLGIQSNHFIDWDWIANVIKSLENNTDGAELQLLKIRMGVLTKLYDTQESIIKYKQLIDKVEIDKIFTFNGVKDILRIDSYFDPFGNLSIFNRLHIEIAREYTKIGNREKAEEICVILYLSYRGLYFNRGKAFFLCK
jgi:hypothetical protein